MEREKEMWRRVPCRTVGGEEDALIAFEPEKFEIYTGEGWKEIRHVLAVLSDTVLDREDRYQGLLPLEILNEMGEFHDGTDKKMDQTLESGFAESRAGVGGAAESAGGDLLCGRQRSAARSFERGRGAKSVVCFGTGRDGGAHHTD
jgi:hypothetical protein